MQVIWGVPMNLVTLFLVPFLVQASPSAQLKKPLENIIIFENFSAYQAILNGVQVYKVVIDYVSPITPMVIQGHIEKLNRVVFIRIPKTYAIAFTDLKKGDKLTVYGYLFLKNYIYPMSIVMPNGKYVFTGLRALFKIYKRSFVKHPHFWYKRFKKFKHKHF